MDKSKELNRLDRRMSRTKELQAELDHRTEVEEKVFRLFSEGKFEEGKALLDTLDDEKVLELAEGDVAAEEESQITTRDITCVVMHLQGLSYETRLRNKEIEVNINCPIDLSKGRLKKILDRVVEETKGYPDVVIRIGMS